MPFKASAQFDVQFSQAQDWFKKRAPALRDPSFAALGATAHAQAFTLAGVSQLSLVNDVWKELEAALETGVDFKDFQKSVTSKLEAAWGGPKPGRVETIWRTNIQSAYSAGRYAQITSPAVLAARPIWVYDTVLDSRTTGICRPLSGVTLEATDPWWDGHIPPLHHRCRSSLRTLRRKPDQQLTDLDKLKPVQVPSTFGRKPTTPVGTPYKPDLVKYVPPLQPRVEQVLKATPTSPLGAPISSALDATGAKSIAFNVKSVLEAIDSVHGDGVLRRIPILTGTSDPDYLGEYASSYSGVPLRIGIKTTGTHKAMTLAHEIGHFLDEQAVGAPGVFASSSDLKLIKNWQKAVNASNVVKDLRAAQKNPDTTLQQQQALDYLLGFEELWARSYAQYIASKSQNALLLADLNRIRNQAGTISLSRQWADEDFIKIQEAFDTLFKAKGWMQ